MKASIWTGVAMSLIGGLVVLGYGIYYLGDEFFGGERVPIAVQIALPVAFVGIVILTATVLIQRLREKDEEDFKELDY